MKIENVKYCAFCSGSFFQKSTLQKYCSKRCKWKAEGAQKSKKPIQKNCDFCEKPFAPYTSLDKFCSVNCRVNNEKSKRSKNWNEESCKNRSGKNNPGFVHGLRMREVKKKKGWSEGETLFNKNKKEYRAELKAKRGYLFCERCDTSGHSHYEAHHIVYRSEKPGHEFLHDKRNLINVCVPCHNWFHKKKSNRDRWVKERKLHLLFGNDILNKEKLPVNDKN